MYIFYILSPTSFQKKIIIRIFFITFFVPFTEFKYITVFSKFQHNFTQINAVSVFISLILYETFNLFYAQTLLKMNF